MTTTNKFPLQGLVFNAGFNDVPVENVAVSKTVILNFVKIQELADKSEAAALRPEAR